MEIVDESEIPDTYRITDMKISLADYRKIMDMVEAKSVKYEVDEVHLRDLQVLWC